MCIEENVSHYNIDIKNLLPNAVEGLNQNTKFADIHFQTNIDLGGHKRVINNNGVFEIVSNFTS